MDCLQLFRCSVIAEDEEEQWTQTKHSIPDTWLAEQTSAIITSVSIKPTHKFNRSERINCENPNASGLGILILF